MQETRHDAEHESSSEHPAPSRWWTVGDVAAYLAVSECSARRLAKRRDFPPSASFGRLRRWRSDQVREWADRQAVPDLYRSGGQLRPGTPRGPRGGRRG